MPQSAPDLKFANWIRLTNPQTGIPNLLDEVNENYQQNTQNIVTVYHKYKTYDNRKTSAQLLKVNDFVFVLNPKYDHHSSKQYLKRSTGRGLHSD